MRCSANVRTTVYSLVVARTGGVGRLSLLGCHLRTSAKHRSLAAYRVRAWPGADARWQAPPKPSWPGLAAEDHGIRLCSSAQSSFGVVVMMAKLRTFPLGPIRAQKSYDKIILRTNASEAAVKPWPTPSSTFKGSAL